jgi:hypothetical protein
MKSAAAIKRYPRLKRVPYPKRPRTRQDCFNYSRPCPWVGCKYHLFLDINGEKIKSYGEDPLEMEFCCALDIADKGGWCLEDIRKIYGLSRERIRQIVEHALRKMRFVKCRKS